MNASVPVSAAPRCPRHAKPKAAEAASIAQWVTCADLHRELFRLFFPLAAAAGLIGVLLWPLMLSGWMQDYPGLRHARLMTQGFFGGFIFGFLGTSLPRLLESRPMTAVEVLPVLFLHALNLAAHTAGATMAGDLIFLAEVLLWLPPLIRRWRERRDLPPPSFVLIPLAFGCEFAGLGIHTVASRTELSPGWDLLARLWVYHAFILLCVLGAGGFLLPRFLGLGVREKFPAALIPAPEWRRAAVRAAAGGVLIIFSYLIEAADGSCVPGILRAGLIVAYLWSVMPLERLCWSWNGVQWLLVAGLFSIPLGILAAGFLPGWRIALSHVELVTGFGFITLGVATRVVFGHSGQRSQLERFHPWLTMAAGLMFVGMLSRLSGDLVPATMASHYLYGAVCWILGLVIWAACALPKVLRPDTEV